MYDYIIATDEGGDEQDDNESGDSGAESQEGREEECASLRIFMVLTYTFLISRSYLNST